jgi:hypothetical protein
MGKGMSQEQVRGALRQKQKELDSLIDSMESYRIRNMEMDRKRGLLAE